jgi:RNA-directed DNA polymerase
MAETKAPSNKRKPPLDPESESWNKLPWRKFEQHVSRIQKRIFRAEQRGDRRAVHKLQKLMMKSRAARLLAVRRVAQENQGKKTAGIDGVKSVRPKERFLMAETIHPKNWKQQKAKPVRRVWIPKPGKAEKRGLGIPIMRERAQQALVKSALEPEWEAKFEANSYGFRPGRSGHDAIAAIFIDIHQQGKFVLDADLKGCFDNISHPALLNKLTTYPAMRHLVKRWLKAGILDHGVFEETTKGTPQGGVVSPLLANIALHGMEKVLQKTYAGKDRPQFVRYADDFVVLHPTLEGVEKAKRVLERWLQDIGLELKPSKTKITHTRTPYQGNVGFDFLGWNVRQYPVGKTHTGKDHTGKPLGFKTIITPSKEAVQRHLNDVGNVIKKRRSASQGQLIKELNPKIRGWTNYHRTIVAGKTFGRCQYILFHQLFRWACRRHPNKGKRWIARKYWHVEEGAWTFTDRRAKLWTHDRTKIQRHTKVKGTASPYDGNERYWSTRLRNHPLLSGTRARLLQKQQGKCKWCGLLFQDGDHIEIDHITPKSHGGGEDLSNKCALHQHCHDARHAQRDIGASDNGSVPEEPYEVKVSRTVLKPSEGGDPFA